MRSQFDFQICANAATNFVRYSPSGTFTRQSSGLSRRVSVPEDTEVFYQEDTPTEGGAFLSHIGTDLSGINTLRAFSTSNSWVKGIVSWDEYFLECTKSRTKHYPGTFWMSAYGFNNFMVSFWEVKSKFNFLLACKKSLTNCEILSSSKPAMNVHWKKSTNESKAKRTEICSNIHQSKYLPPLSGLGRLFFFSGTDCL